MKKMKTFGVFCAGISLAIAATSCIPGGSYVSRSEYEAVLEDYNELKETSDAAREIYSEQARMMDKVFSELSAISRRTSALRGDIESGTARLIQAEQIEASIEDIKDQLSSLDKLTRNNRELRKTVDNLKKVISDKEAEIESLKEELRQKDQTIEAHEVKINEQENVISEQVRTISAQSERLRRQVQEQARLLYNAGVDFEAIADASPEITLKKNRSKVRDWTSDMYQNALTYYTKAKEAGYQGCDESIDRVKAKINGTEE